MSIAVAQVEKELAQLRRETARTKDPENLFPDIRAAVATLVAWVANPAEASETASVAVQLAGRHPCRTVVVVPGDGAVGADASAQCTLAPAGERQLCCEQVVLHGGSVAQAASAAEQLLLTDVPVVVWSVAGPWPEEADRLLDSADRLIIDSHRADDPFAAAGSLVVTRSARPGLWVADLDWGRLTPWRVLMAQLFDAPALQTHLDDLRAIRLRHVERGLRPYLLAGWVLDRLGLDPAGVEIDVEEVEEGAARGLGAGHLLGFELVTAHGSFSVERAEDTTRLVARARVPDGAPPERSLPIPGPDLVRVLSEELAQVGQDEAFLGALRIAGVLTPPGPVPTPRHEGA